MSNHHLIFSIDYSSQQFSLSPSPVSSVPFPQQYPVIAYQRSLLKQELGKNDIISKLLSELNRSSTQNEELRKQHEKLRQQLQTRSQCSNK